MASAKAETPDCVLFALLLLLRCPKEVPFEAYRVSHCLMLKGHSHSA